MGPNHGLVELIHDGRRSEHADDGLQHLGRRCARMLPSKGTRRKSGEGRSKKRSAPNGKSESTRPGTAKKQRTNKLDKGKGKAYIDVPTLGEDDSDALDEDTEEAGDADMLDEELELDEGAVAFAGGLDRKGITRCVAPQAALLSYKRLIAKDFNGAQIKTPARERASPQQTRLDRQVPVLCLPPQAASSRSSSGGRRR